MQLNYKRTIGPFKYTLNSITQKDYELSKIKGKRICMKKKESKIAILLYILGILSCIIFLFTKTINLIILGVILLLLSSILQTNKNKIIMYTLLIIFFIGLGYFLLFEPLFRRHGLFQDWNFKIFIKDMINSSNIIPFKTIMYYLHNIFDYKEAFKLSLDTYGLFLNFFGNLLCLTPLAIILPLCTDKQKKYKNFLLTIMKISIIIELIQILTNNGVFDIDDIILNAGGAIIAYFIVNPHIIYLIENILLKKEHKINILQTSIRVVIILLCGISFILGYNYRKQIELDYINFISDYEIKIEYKNNECNNKIKEYFYEDELYKYYLTCHSIDETTIYINNISYSIEEIFNNKTEYIINLERLIEEEFVVEKEEKNERLEICGILGNRLSFFYDDEDVVYFEYLNKENKNNKTCTNVFMIPQKDGTSMINFYIEKDGTKTTKLTYEFTVIDNKITKYELIETK